MATSLFSYDGVSKIPLLYGDCDFEEVLAKSSDCFYDCIYELQNNTVIILLRKFLPINKISQRRVLPTSDKMTLDIAMSLLYY